MKGIIYLGILMPIRMEILFLLTLFYRHFSFFDFYLVISSSSYIYRSRQTRSAKGPLKVITQKLTKSKNGQVCSCFVVFLLIRVAGSSNFREALRIS